MADEAKDGKNKDVNETDSEAKANAGKAEEAGDTKPESDVKPESSDDAKKRGLPSGKEEIRKALNQKPADPHKPRRRSKLREDIRRQLTHADAESAGGIPPRVKVMAVLAVIAAIMAVGYQVMTTRKDRKLNIHVACEKGDLETVKMVLAREPSMADFPTDGDLRPLHIAAKQGNLEIVRLLIEHRAKVGYLDQRRRIPLHYAAEAGNLDVVQLLLNKGAPVRVPDKDGMPPLHLAASRGHADIVELLLRHQANVNSVSAHRMTALHHAVLQDHLDVAKVLIKYRAPVNAANSSGYTALYYAVVRENVPLVKLLLKAGADPMLPKDSRGPADAVKEKEYPNEEIRKLILDAIK